MASIATKIGAASLVIIFLFTAFAATDVSAENNESMAPKEILITNEGYEEPHIAGATYDKVNDVLEINNVKASGIVYQGHGMLTLVVKGNCVLERVIDNNFNLAGGITAKSIKITGSGSLTIVNRIGINSSLVDNEGRHAPEGNVEIDGLAHLKIIAPNKQQNKKDMAYIGIRWNGFGDVIIKDCPDVTIEGVQIGIDNGYFSRPYNEGEAHAMDGDIIIKNSAIKIKTGDKMGTVEEKAIIAVCLGKIYCDSCIGNATFYNVTDVDDDLVPMDTFKSGEVNYITVDFNQEVTLGKPSYESTMIIVSIIIGLVLIAAVGAYLKRKSSKA